MLGGIVRTKVVKNSACNWQHWCKSCLHKFGCCKIASQSVYNWFDGCWEPFRRIFLVLWFFMTKQCFELRRTQWPLLVNDPIDKRLDAIVGIYKTWGITLLSPTLMWSLPTMGSLEPSAMVMVEGAISSEKPLRLSQLCELCKLAPKSSAH